MNIQIKIKQIILSSLIILVFNACQDLEEPEYQGEVNFSLDNVQFSNTAVPNARIETNSLWQHIYKPNAVLNIKHTASGKEYTLDYNPNTFGTFSRTLPYGAYTFESTVAGGLFEEYLPYTISGEFTLESEKLEIKLTATTEYGLISVKNQSISEAKVTAGTTSRNLKLLDDKTYSYIYSKAQTSTALAITETVFGTTINRTIPMLAYKHFNYIIDLKQGNLNLIDLVLDPFGYEEETIGSVSFKFFEENGTIKCPNTIPGETGIVNGKKYESVDRALLIQRRDEGADLTCVCTTLVTDMNHMFTGTDQNTNTFNQAIGNWDVSNVTNMRGMFFENKDFNQPIGNWNVSNVTNMQYMFQGSKFNQPIGNWNVSNVENMRYMFALTPFNQPIGNWNVSKVQDMSGLFYSTPFNHPIGDWNVGNVEQMYHMFLQTKVFNQPIGNWNVSKVINMEGMFAGSVFNQALGDWNVGNVINMAEMFMNSPFNQPLGNWDVSKVNYMYSMFNNSNFNQPIEKWNLGNAINISYMFALTPFNQPIGNWNVSKVKDMSGLFYSTPFNHSIGDWNVGNVERMYHMFLHTKAFNQPIGGWNVAKVITMEGMFEGSAVFNQYLGDWNVSNVTKMNSMFRDANNFNQNISNWCVSRLATEPTEFSLNSPLTTQNKPLWGTCPN